VYLLSSKSEVTKYLKEFVSQAESRFDRKLNKLRCDNGGEYRVGQLKEWCKNKGITLDYTVPYTPQLNGKAEKLNRTLDEKARAMLFDSNLDSEMCGEAILSAAYLLNRLPTTTIATTPAEKWYREKPNLKRIRLFGCKAYAKKLTQLKKFESRTQESIFVGYTDNGYRLWNPKKKEKFLLHEMLYSMKMNSLKGMKKLLIYGLIYLILIEIKIEKKYKKFKMKITRKTKDQNQNSPIQMNNENKIDITSDTEKI
jgi:hypothetical protein